MAEFVRDMLRPGQLPTLKWGAWVKVAPGRATRALRWHPPAAARLDVRLGAYASIATTTGFLDHAVELAKLAPGLPAAEALRYHRALLRKLNLPDTTLSARFGNWNRSCSTTGHFSR